MVTHETRCSCLLGLRRAEFSPAFNSVNVVSNDPGSMPLLDTQTNLQYRVRIQGIAHPPPGSIEIRFIKGLSIQAGSEPILSILERSAWGSIRGHVLK